VLIGSTIGIIAGFARGVLDDALMFLVDVQLAMPFIVIALAVIAIFGSNLTVLLFLVGIAGWEGFARIARGMVLATQENQYVDAAKRLARPEPDRVPTYRSEHRRPADRLRNDQPDFDHPAGVDAELPRHRRPAADGLLGIDDRSGRDYLYTAWWIAVFPGAAIVMVTMSISLFR
jgi:peptide/nickel transport system permease protein